MLDHARRQRHAGHLADALGPQAGAVDEDVAGDRAAIGDDADRAAVLDDDLLDGDAFLDPRAVLPRALGVGHGQRIGVDIAVAGDVGRALDAVLDDEREMPCRLGGRQRMALDAEALGLPHRAADFAPARRAAGEPQRADLLPGDVLAGLGLQPVEHGDRVLHQPGQVALAAQLPDQAGRVPGAAMRELRLLDQQHVLRAVTRKVVGERRADRPAADDEDVDVTVSAEGHGGHAFTSPSTASGNGSPAHS